MTKVSAEAEVHPVGYIFFTVPENIGARGPMEPAATEHGGGAPHSRAAGQRSPVSSGAENECISIA